SCPHSGARGGGRGAHGHGNRGTQAQAFYTAGTTSRGLDHPAAGGGPNRPRKCHSRSGPRRQTWSQRKGNHPGGFTAEIAGTLRAGGEGLGGTDQKHKKLEA